MNDVKQEMNVVTVLPKDDTERTQEMKKIKGGNISRMDMSMARKRAIELADRVKEKVKGMRLIRVDDKTWVYQ